MNYKIILLLFFTIFILTPLFALDCQYTQSVFDHAETIAVPYSVDSDDPIEEITYTIAGTEKAPIYFFNENDFNVDIEFDLLYYIPGGYTGNYGPHTSHITRTIIPGTSEMAFGYSKGYYSKISNLIYRQNEFVYLKNKEKKVYIEICKVCGDVNCLDDGLACSINSECGSNNCIRGLCSAGVTCYNNDCNCAVDELQFENRVCIKKNSVAIGGTPQTSNPEECITNYISSITKNCAVALGDSCTKNLDCAENYCVMSTCSTSNIYCYNNNCNCKPNEIQFQNKTCVLINSVDDGEKTITGNKLECVSNTIDIDTNICKSDCNSNQISYNYTCINKKSAINGVIPQTGNREECKSEYIDPRTGKCAMTSGTKIMIWSSIVFILLACGAFFLFYILKSKQKIKEKEQDNVLKIKEKEIAAETKIKEKELDIKKLDTELDNSKEKVKIAELEYKTEKSKKEKTERKLKTLDKEINSIKKEQEIYILQLKRLKNLENKTVIESEKIDAITKKLKDKTAEIERKKKERKQEEEELNKSEQETANRKESLEQQKGELKKQENEINAKRKSLKKEEKQNSKIIKILKKQKEEIKELAKPHYNKQNSLVIVNNAGYEERLDGKSFHRWWYIKHNGSIKPGYVIHHIDGDRLNNNINNLIAIPEEVHRYKINHNKIKDRQSGLEELRRKGIDI